MADERREDVAVDTAQVAHLVRVEAASLGPEPHAAQQRAEGREAGHELLDEVGDARAVEALLGAKVDALQDRVVVDVQRLRHRVEWQLREEEVQVHAVKVEGDDGDLGGLDGAQVFDLVTVLEDYLQAVEEVVARHHPRRDADGVDVGAALVEPEAVRARGEHQAAGAVGRFGVVALGQAHRAHPIAEERSERRDDVRALVLLLLSLGGRRDGHESLELLGGHQVEGCRAREADGVACLPRLARGHVGTATSARATERSLLRAFPLKEAGKGFSGYCPPPRDSSLEPRAHRA